MWDLDRTFATIAEAGFQAVELMVTRDARTQSAEAPLALAAKHGLHFVAVHAPMLLVTKRVWGPNFLDIITKTTALTKQLGAKLLVVHPPLLWELKYQAWLLGELDAYMAANQVSVAVENMFHVWMRDRAVRGYRWLSPADLDGFAQITLDTSHCGVDGTDILSALDRVGPRLAHVHLSDSKGDHRDSHALPGTGVLPLNHFVRRLPEAGFTGTLSLELDLRELTQEPAKLQDALVRAREYCLERLP